MPGAKVKGAAIQTALFSLDDLEEKGVSCAYRFIFPTEKTSSKNGMGLVVGLLLVHVFGERGGAFTDT